MQGGHGHSTEGGAVRGSTATARQGYGEVTARTQAERYGHMGSENAGFARGQRKKEKKVSDEKKGGKKMKRTGMDGMSSCA